MSIRSIDDRDFAITVNGTSVTIRGAEPGASLLTVLRQHGGLNGTKGACEEGECGSCSVLVDGRLVCSCLVMAASAADSAVTTIEGLAPAGMLNDVQQAFIEHGAVQCGFCTPGLVMAITELVARQPEISGDSIREALAGNLCRCTGYGRIVAAVESVVRRRQVER